jgi:hypothetical protein
MTDGRVASGPSESPASDGTPAAAPRPRIPGWTLVFAAGQAFAIVLRARYLARTGGVLWRLGTRNGTASDIVRAYASTRAVLLVMLLALGIAGIVKILRRGRDTRWYWLVGLPLMVAISAAMLAMTVTEAKALAAANGHPVASHVDVPVALGGFVAAVLWWAYWKRSRRVREAFSPPAWLPNAPRADRPHEAPVPAHAG